MNTSLPQRIKLVFRLTRALLQNCGHDNRNEHEGHDERRYWAREKHQLPERNVWCFTFYKPHYHVHAASMKPLSVFNETSGHSAMFVVPEPGGPPGRSKRPRYPVLVRRRPPAAVSGVTAVLKTHKFNSLLFSRMQFVSSDLESVWENHRRCESVDRVYSFLPDSNTNKPEEVPGPDWAWVQVYPTCCLETVEI